MLFSLLVVTTWSPAQEPIAAFAESWRWRVFDRREGLSSSSISALHQDRQEYIYAATERGVCRYDLWEWSVLENAQPFDDGEIVRFVESPNTLLAVTANALWKVHGGTTLAQFYRGGGIHAAVNDLGDIFAIDARTQEHLQVRGEALERLDEVRLPSGRAHAYEISSTRSHWLATADGLFVRQTGRRAWRELEDRDLDPALAALRCVRFFRVANGNTAWQLWGLFVEANNPTAAQRIARLDNGVWTALGSVPGSLLGQITGDARGDYVATAEDGRLLHSSDGRDWTLVANLGIGRSALHGGLLDSAGMLWFRHSAGGVAAFDARSRSWESIAMGTSELFPRVYSVLETEDGSVWMGLAGGVARSQPGKAPDLWERVQGIALEKITGLAADGLGRVWISSGESFVGTMHFDPDADGWAREEGPGAIEHRIRRIVEDRSGELWFLSTEPSLDRGYTLYRLGLATSYELKPVSLAHGPINDLARTRDESFWFATDDGLLQTTLVEGRFAVGRRWTTADGLLSLQVWAVTEGPDGAIWVCYPSSGGGVTRILDDEVRSFQEVDGLASPDVWSILAVGQNLWFGTGRGLSRFDGECWYSYPLASIDFKSIRVWPLASSRLEPDCLILGTFGQGAYKFRLEDRRRPRFASTPLATRASRRGDIHLEWDARDYRNETPRDHLVYRSRLDGRAWSRFSNARAQDFEGLAPGRHTLEVEVRDLAGNRNREELLHVFEVPSGAWSFAGEGSVTAVAAWGSGLLVLALAAWLILRRLKRHRGTWRFPGESFADWPDALLLIDADGRVVDWNGAGARVIGIEGVASKDILGRPASLLPVFFGEEGKAVLQSLQRGIPVKTTRCRLQGQDGAERVVDITGFAPGGKRRHVLVSIEDATAAVAQESLKERERRLSSLRRLAGCVAVDLTEALELADGLDRDSPAAARRLSRLAEVSRRLGDFAGQRHGEAMAPVDLHRVLERLLDAASGRLPGLRSSPGVKVDYRGQPGLWSVVLAEAQLESALIEVLRNALEAMAQQGTLTLRTRNLRLEGDDGGFLADGAYVEVSIKDTGGGMDSSQLERLFEPFHSTKPRQESLGIGLAVAYGVARAAGGDIRVESRPGQGTTVRLVLRAVLDI